VLYIRREDGEEFFLIVPEAGPLLTFRDRQAAAAFLRSWQGDPDGMRFWREQLARQRPGIDLRRLSDAQVVDELSWWLADGRIRVARRFEVGSVGATALEEPPPATAPPPQHPPAPATTWVEFKIVWDDTGQPVPRVRFRVTTPDGNEKFHTTAANGAVRIDGIDPGECTVRSEVKSPLPSNTLAFAGMGEPASAGAPPQADGKEPPSRKGIQQIALVEAHKVKKGENLKGLAEGAGLTWKQLAKFNWGTDVPKEINGFLRRRVGCTKKTPDGYNYSFDDSDDPGIVHIPKTWEQTGLATGQTHVIRVKEPLDVFLVLENEEGLPVPEVAYQVAFADGTTRSGKLGKAGIARIENPPRCSFEVEYPDEDDILAKSLAALVRKGFDDRKTDELFRLMEFGETTVKAAIAAYDRYFDTLTGKGLIEDIYQELSDPDALLAAESLLAFNKAESHAELETEWTEEDDEDEDTGSP